MQKRKALLAVAVLLGAYTAASVAAVRWEINFKVPCAQPCRDLGEEVLEAPKRWDHVAVYKPKCQPLQLDLELHRPKARSYTQFSLWYKARLVNRSCFDLWGILTNDFQYCLDEFGSKSFTGMSFTFRVVGPDGVEVRQGNFVRSSEYEFIYRANGKELAKWNTLYEEYEQRFPPGGEIRSIPTELAPHKSYLIIPDAEAVRHMTSFRHESVLRPAAPPPGTEEPPPGFRILDAYRFHRKGTYRIQAVYHGDLTAELLSLPVGFLPRWLTLPVRLIEKCGLDVTGPSREYVLRGYRVETTSPWKEFVVDFSPL